MTLLIKQNDKNVMQNAITKMVSRVVLNLKNTSDIEKITDIMGSLVTQKITKGRLEDLDELITQYINKASDEAIFLVKELFIICSVKEIIYDKPLLNHPELLKAALGKFSLQKIGELSNELDHNLIDAAINNNDDELILAGLISLGNLESIG